MNLNNKTIALIFALLLSVFTAETFAQKKGCCKDKKVKSEMKTQVNYALQLEGITDSQKDQITKIDKTFNDELNVIVTEAKAKRAKLESLEKDEKANEKEIKKIKSEFATCKSKVQDLNKKKDNDIMKVLNKSQKAQYEKHIKENSKKSSCAMKSGEKSHCKKEEGKKSHCKDGSTDKKKSGGCCSSKKK